MMLPSRLDCPLSLKTTNMGNPGRDMLVFRASVPVVFGEEIARWVISNEEREHRR